MQVLDRTGVGTLWSICKAKFALAGHTHSSITDGTMTVYSMQNNEVNFGGSNGSATIYFGYRAKDSKPIPSNFVFGGSTGTATLTAAKFKGALEGNASTASNASTVNGHTVNANVPSNAKFTDTNTWRGIQDNLTSTSTSESLSANQGRVLKGLVDGKANSSHTHTLGQITNAGAAASKNVRTLNSVSHSSWASASTDNLYVPTMSFIAYWNGAYNSSGNSNLQYCYKGKFGNLAVKDTADWSQVANKPATATRWPSWGEVTGKPELKNWSETKSYIDSKAASSGGVDSLPVGTELISYNDNNIFGDKFLKEDGSYHKKTDVQLDLGAVRKFYLKNTIIQSDYNYDSGTIVYFDGYYYIRKIGYYSWVRSTSLTGKFSDYAPLDGCSQYIGNGAFSFPGVNKQITVVINRGQYTHGAYSYSGGYFLTENGITSDFSSYISTSISYTSGYMRCKNNPDYLYNSKTNLLQIAKLSTAKVVAQVNIENVSYIEEFCYDKSKNIGAAITRQIGNNVHVYIIDFSKRSIIYRTTLSVSSPANNYINIIGSIIVYSNGASMGCHIYDYINKIEAYIDLSDQNCTYNSPLVVNNSLYISSESNNHRNKITLVTIGFEGYDSTKYYQIKNNPRVFVKVK